MSDLGAVLGLFLASTAGLALKAILVAAFVDFATGTFAALRDGTFAVDALAAFVRKHIWGRVAPIGTLLLVGYAAADQVILTGAGIAAAAYAAETIGSVLGNLNPPKEGDVKVDEVAVEVNPVPKD